MSWLHRLGAYRLLKRVRVSDSRSHVVSTLVGQGARSHARDDAYERSFRRGMLMGLIKADQYAAMRKREQSGEAGVFFSHPLGCESCSVALQESQTGCRQLSDGQYLCSDCYFDALDDALEALPILPPRVRHRV